MRRAQHAGEPGRHEGLSFVAPGRVESRDVLRSPGRQQFFLAAVAFEGKDLEILGWAGPQDAIALVRDLA